MMAKYEHSLSTTFSIIKFKMPINGLLMVCGRRHFEARHRPDALEI